MHGTRTRYAREWRCTGLDMHGSGDARDWRCMGLDLHGTFGMCTFYLHACI